MTTTTDVTAQDPLTHEDAMQLQVVELERTLDLLRSLDDVDWSAQTDCPDWDVHHMYLHVLGACDAAASMKENVHQMRAAKRHQKAEGGPLEAGLSTVQVRERLDLTPAQLVDRLTAVAPVVVRKRTKLPALVRRVPLKVDGPVVETWRLGYLVDTVYLRDLWMHRVDAARATGRELVLDQEHDGRIIGEVVAEWARRHGRPFTLRLTGPAGGTFTSSGSDPSRTDDDADTLELDAVEFCRTLGGRTDGTGLLATIVPF
jgi:uncharacterized protein (TIGR03083 family)